MRRGRQIAASLFLSAVVSLALKKTVLPLTPETTEVRGLPLVEVPAQGGAGGALAVIITGDGGWAPIDKQLAKTLSAHGVPVAALNSLKYFWKARTPEKASRDLERILRHYTAAWGKNKILLIGYSRGADVAPFMASRLPTDLADKIVLIAMLGLGKETALEIRMRDLLGLESRKNLLSVLPEVEKLRGRKMLCVYGDEEKDSACPVLDAALAAPVRLKGAHHFDRDYKSLAERILKEAGL